MNHRRMQWVFTGEVANDRRWPMSHAVDVADATSVLGFGAKAAEKCVAQARKPTCLRMTLNGSEKPEGSFTLAVQR